MSQGPNQKKTQKADVTSSRPTRSARARWWQLLTSYSWCWRVVVFVSWLYFFLPLPGYQFFSTGASGGLLDKLTGIGFMILCLLDGYRFLCLHRPWWRWLGVVEMVLAGLHLEADIYFLFTGGYQPWGTMALSRESDLAGFFLIATMFLGLFCWLASVSYRRRVTRWAASGIIIAIVSLLGTIVFGNWLWSALGETWYMIVVLGTMLACLACVIIVLATGRYRWSAVDTYAWPPLQPPWSHLSAFLLVFTGVVIVGSGFYVHRYLGHSDLSGEWNNVSMTLDRNLMTQLRIKSLGRLELESLKATYTNRGGYRWMWIAIPDANQDTIGYLKVEYHLCPDGVSESWKEDPTLQVVDGIALVAERPQCGDIGRVVHVKSQWTDDSFAWDGSGQKYWDAQVYVPFDQYFLELMATTSSRDEANVAAVIDFAGDFIHNLQLMDSQDQELLVSRSGAASGQTALAPISHDHIFARMVQIASWPGAEIRTIPVTFARQRDDLHFSFLYDQEATSAGVLELDDVTEFLGGGERRRQEILALLQANRLERLDNYRVNNSPAREAALYSAGNDVFLLQGYQLSQLGSWSSFVEAEKQALAPLSGKPLFEQIIKSGGNWHIPADPEGSWWWEMNSDAPTQTADTTIQLHRAGAPAIEVRSSRFGATTEKDQAFEHLQEQVQSLLAANHLQPYSPDHVTFDPGLGRTATLYTDGLDDWWAVISRKPERIEKASAVTRARATVTDTVLHEDDTAITQTTQITQTGQMVAPPFDGYLIQVVWLGSLPDVDAAGKEAAVVFGASSEQTPEANNCTINLEQKPAWAVDGVARYRGRVECETGTTIVYYTRSNDRVKPLAVFPRNDATTSSQSETFELCVQAREQKVSASDREHLEQIYCEPFGIYTE